MQNLFCHCAAPVTVLTYRLKCLCCYEANSFGLCFYGEAVQDRTKCRSTYFLTMPRTSSSRMMRNSSPSSLISVPEYLPKRMVSPALTSSGNTLPSSFDLPLPTAITSPCCGFSLAESGMMMPPRMLSPSSMRRTRMRSCRGVNFVVAIAYISLLQSKLVTVVEVLNRGRLGASPEFGVAPQEKV